MAGKVTLKLNEASLSRYLGFAVLRVFRLAVIASVVLAIHFSRPGVQTGPVAPELATVRKWMPDAESLSARDPSEGGYYVYDAFGDPIGYCLMTSPETDDITGYSGPSNILILLTSSNHIHGIELLGSADTPDHVQLVREDTRFFASYSGMSVDDLIDESGVESRLRFVSGATLTSSAIARSISRRLSGGDQSYLFPFPLELKEVQKIYPEAVTLLPDEEVPGLTAIVDSDADVIGYVERSSPQGEHIIGYKGPSDVMIAYEPDRETVKGLFVRESYETEEYLSYVTGDGQFLSSFSGMKMDEFASLDIAGGEVGGVSGATRTSLAVVEAARQKAAWRIDEKHSVRQLGSGLQWGWRDSMIVFWVFIGIALSSTRLRGYARLRLMHKTGLVIILGFIMGDMISLVLFQGWARHGLPWQHLPGLTFLAVISLMYPWLTGRQLYCHHICPHGAAQSLMMRLTTKRWKVSGGLEKFLSIIPLLLLLVAMMISCFADGPSLSVFEPFDGYVIAVRAAIPIAIGLTGLIISVFLPLGYCRYGCPTGFIFKFLRWRGSGDRFSRMDRGGLVIMGFSLIVILVRVLK